MSGMLTDNPVRKKVALKRTLPRGKRNYTDKEKLEAVKTYLMTGSALGTAAALGIHRNTMNVWVHSQWFKELLEQFKRETSLKLSSRLKKIATNALDLVEDRLENGDWIYDQKAGELRRKPVSIRDGHKIAKDFVETSIALDKKQEQEQVDTKLEDRFAVLAEAFASFAKKAVKVEVVDALPNQRETGLQEGGEVGERNPPLTIEGESRERPSAV